MTTVESKSWLDRNWKWAFPFVCSLGFVGFVAFIVIIVSVVFYAIKSSEAYTEAIEIAQSNVYVLEELGEPIETGWYVMGSINMSGSCGAADLSIPIYGPFNKGTVYVIAEKSAGRWSFELLEVEIAGRRDRINLLPHRESIEEDVLHPQLRI